VTRYRPACRVPSTGRRCSRPRSGVARSRRWPVPEKTPVGEPAGGADEQNPDAGRGLEEEHTEAIVATEPWAREAPRNQTTGKAGAKGVSLAVPEAGVNVVAAAARKALAHVGRACAGLSPRLSCPRKCQAGACG
jgi:hypothetical protein